MTVWGAVTFFEWQVPENILLWLTAFFGVILAIYTAFLFAQAKGRDFWQSPTLPLHMLVHSVMAGAAVFSILALFTETENWMGLLGNVISIALVVNLLTLVSELTITHPTKAAKKVVTMILKERYQGLFWGGTIIVGNLLPLILVQFVPGAYTLAAAGVLILIGIYVTEKIWVEAPQRIPLA